MSHKVLVTDRVNSGKVRFLRAILMASLKALSRPGSEVSVLITGDGEMRSLNKKYRNIDRTTDVLSFPMDDAVILGDIVISMEKVVAQAREYGVGEDGELARVAVHGLLHLLGYDHVKGGRQARQMKLKEAELLKALLDKGLLVKTDAAATANNSSSGG
ncbi:MAG: hypothetical protein BMS9Abin23_1025 [Thermodesulfobacteriota bacterium]|nr:MAG: hypothetical protein BMS9Abin23_1025 [Thermodesulfobacteriota bacterium]